MTAHSTRNSPFSTGSGCQSPGCAARLHGCSVSASGDTDGGGGVRGGSPDAAARRWNDDRGRIFDVMPDDAGVLGFSNEWYGPAFEDAEQLELPGGTHVKVATPPYLFALKFRAFDHPLIISRCSCDL